MLRFDPLELDAAAQMLPPWKRIAFMAHCCQRTLGEFERFHKETLFGDPAILRGALNAIWAWVKDGTPVGSLEEVLLECEKQAPDTERFTSPYTSAALDAVNSIITTLEATRNPDDAKVSEVASLARDTVDLFVQFALDEEPTHPRYERLITEHVLMQRELRVQSDVLQRLRDVVVQRSEAVAEIRESALAAGGPLDPV